MQSLLPSPQTPAKDAKSPDDAGSGGGGGGNAAQQNNSKAATVESAIEYIKQLQKQRSEHEFLMGEKEREMEALRREIAALKKGSGGMPSTESEDVMHTQTKKEGLESSAEGIEAGDVMVNAT